jgi:hypothetical protein
MTAHHTNQAAQSALSTPLGFFGFVALCLLLSVPVRGGQSVSLGWNASASVGVAGYTVYCGTNSGIYPTSCNAGTNLEITLTGLAEGTTNYFTVAGYNSAGLAGAPSTQISYLVPGCIQLVPPAKSGGAPGLSFPVAAGHTYEVQASTNLTSWMTIYITNTAASNIWVNYQDPQWIQFPQRFYRLILQ